MRIKYIRSIKIQVWAIVISCFVTTTTIAQSPVLNITKLKDLSCNFVFPCDGSAEVTINWNGLPEPSSFNLIWSSVEIGNNAQFLCEGWQFVTLSYANVELIDSIEIYKPLPLSYTLEKKNETCVGARDGTISIDDIQGGTPPYDVLWSNGSSSYYLENLGFGSYSAEVSDMNNCQVSFETNILEGVDVNLEIDTLLSTKLQCFGDSDANIVLNTSSLISIDSYEWTPNVSESRFGLELAAGIYSVKVVSDEGCIDSISYTIDKPDSIEYQLLFDSLICTGTETSLNIEAIGGTGNLDIYVNEEEYAGILEVEEGEYEIVISDSLGCSVTELVTLENYLPTDITMPSEITILEGDSLLLSLEFNSEYGLDTILWSNSLYEDCTECEEQMIYGIQNENIVISLVDINDCVEVHQLKVILDEGGEIFYSNIFSPNGDGHNDAFILQFESPVMRLLSFSVYDRFGNIHYELREPRESPFYWSPAEFSQLLSEGVYVFSAELIKSDNSIIPMKGDITIIR